MEITKATKLLKDIQINIAYALDAEDLNSIQLGIEALKAWKCSRDFLSVHQVPLLPGETID